MKQLSGVLFALAILLSAGCTVPISQSSSPTPVVKAVAVAPTPVQTIKITDEDTFNQHVNRLNPSLQKYVKRLYRDYHKKAWKFQKWTRMHQYVLETHRKAEKQYKFNNPITRKDIYQIVYGIKTYPIKWKLDQDWAVSDWTHESGFLDIIGDKINKKTGKPNPPSGLSLGIGQVQLDTATGDLKARGYDPTGLTVEDLLYFRLMNMDISACVMASKVHHMGYENGTKAYNAGDFAWKDGRSDKYLSDVEGVYSQRSKWNPVPTKTPTVVPETK